MTKEGIRNLRLESLYQATEARFGAAVGKIVSGVRPVDSDIEAVVLFTAAQMVRTPKFRDQWRFATREELEAQLAPFPTLKITLSDFLAALNENRLQLLSLVTFSKAYELLSNMRIRFFRAPLPRAFITSDAPCCVIEYKDLERSALTCLYSRTVNVLIPLSPEVVAIFDHSDDPHGMLDIFPGHSIVPGINSMIWTGTMNDLILPNGRIEEAWFESETLRKAAAFVVR